MAAETFELTLKSIQALDPRAANCRGFHKRADGKVDGIALVYEPDANAEYEVYSVSMTPEADAKGVHVIKYLIYDANGILDLSKVAVLAYPWPDCPHEDLPGNPNQEHPVVNKFYAPNIGPLACYMVDAQGRRISERVGGFGLPDGAHVWFTLVFRQRQTGAVDPEPEPPDEPTDPDADGELALLRRIAVAGEKLVAHLGA